MTPPQSRRIPDQIPSELNDTVLIMRTNNPTTAVTVERALGAQHANALVELVEQAGAIWIVASARDITADQLWNEAQQSLGIGNELERRIAIDQWQSATRSGDDER